LPKERGNVVTAEQQQYYTSRVAAIPLPPPPPPPPPPIPEYVPRLAYDDERKPLQRTLSGTYVLDDDGEYDGAPAPDDWDMHGPNGPTAYGGRPKDALKRTASGVASEPGSDGDVAPKRRRVDGAAEHGALAPDAPADAKDKARAAADDDSASAAGKPRKKDRAKKAAADAGAASVMSPDDGAASRAASPAPSVSSQVYPMYELGEPIPQLKRARKVDEMTMAKRLRNLEEAQKKVWTNIARKDIVKVRSSHVARRGAC
jgi:DNA helicase INO80